jgi:hypothetical protein
VKAGIAQHPHWRNDAVTRQMHDDIATRAAAHEGVNPESSVGKHKGVDADGDFDGDK